MRGNRTQPHLVLLATGGTIASRTSALDDSGTVATDSGAELLQSTGAENPIPVRVIDVFRKGSYLFSFEDMLAVCQAIREALTDPDVQGVVVTHGTDTMEETAYLADLLHADSRPVVFTGAQCAADDPAPDGPDNVNRAIAVASSPDAADQGVLIVFAGNIFHAAGTRKSETQDRSAFSNPQLGSAGSVSAEGLVQLVSGPVRFDPLPWPSAVHPADSRVDLVACYPGADATLLDAAVSAGASGLVLQATGIGNANLVMCAAVSAATGSGVAVVTSTRVNAGPILPVYGAGGGKDLLKAGAIPSGLLRPSQSLILLTLLLRLGSSLQDIAVHFERRGALTASNQHVAQPQP